MSSVVKAFVIVALLAAVSCAPSLPADSGQQPLPAPPSQVQEYEVPDRGTLLVRSTPPSKVFLDGRPLGTVSEVERQVGPGTHTLKFVHPRLGSRAVRFKAIAGKEVEIAADLTVDTRSDSDCEPSSLPPPGPGEAQLGGTLTVRSEPAAEVIVDGRSLGLSPKVKHPIGAGWHCVVFVHPKYGRRVTRVNVVAGKETKVEAKFP